MDDRFKFRAWNGNQMLTMPMGSFYGAYRFFGLLDENADKPITLMQSTGLRDKTRTKEYPKGKLIFEGNIVRAEGYVNPSVFKIVFADGGYGAIHPSKDDGYVLDINHFYPSCGCKLTIIGDIHRNPELLEAQDD